MQDFRRDFLKMAGLSIAAGATTLVRAPQAAAQSASTPATAGRPVYFDVRQFGARGDGKTIDTPAVNAAIDAAANVGGGTVYFPGGVYACYSIHLKSNVALFLDQGATILAASTPYDGMTSGGYDAAEPQGAWEPYQDYGHNHWHNSLIWGENIHDFGIFGPGLIWGKGLSRGHDEKTLPNTTAPGVGNKAIALKNCHNVLLRDFSVLKGGHFALLLTGVDNLTIDNLKIDTDRDGMDIDCCQNVRVSNCTVNSPWDDGICPKSSFALGYARPTKNVTISNCWVTGWFHLGTVLDGTYKRFDPNSRHAFGTGRIKCGTESNGGFLNIAIANCVFEGCLGYAFESVDGALLEDVAITNTTMRDLGCGPIFLRLGSRLRGPKDSTKVGTIKRILIDNLVCHNAPRRICSIFSGIPGAPIEDVTLSNLYIETVGGGTAADAQIQPPEDESQYPEPSMFGTMPASGFFLRHVNNLDMSHIEIANSTPDARPAFSLNAVNRADFFAITAPRGEGGAFALHDVKDLRIGWSRAAADVTLASAENKIL